MVKGVSLTELDTTNLIDLVSARGLVPSSFARDIRGMAGVRKAIVHVYVNLDHRAIHETVARRLLDFDEFDRHVIRYLEREVEAR